jgi:hypothetical protein
LLVRIGRIQRGVVILGLSPGFGGGRAGRFDGGRADVSADLTGGLSG